LISRSATSTAALSPGTTTSCCNMVGAPAAWPTLDGISDSTNWPDPLESKGPQILSELAGVFAAARKYNLLPSSKTSMPTATLPPEGMSCGDIAPAPCQ